MMISRGKLKKLGENPDPVPLRLRISQKVIGRLNQRFRGEKPAPIPLIYTYGTVPKGTGLLSPAGLILINK
jgi:hypothetical protein